MLDAPQDSARIWWSWIGSAIARGVRSTELQCPPGRSRCTRRRHRCHRPALRRRLKDILGQTWVMENRAAPATRWALPKWRVPPPTARRFLTNADIHLMAKHVMRQVPYDPVADFSPISRLATSPMVFVGHPGRTPSDLKALAAEMKAAPGQTHLSRIPGSAPWAISPARVSTTASASRRCRHLPWHSACPNRCHRRTDNAHGRPARQRLAADPGRQPARLRDYVRAARAAVAVVPTIAEEGFPGLNFMLWYASVGPEGHADRPCHTDQCCRAGRLKASRSGPEARRRSAPSQ